LPIKIKNISNKPAFKSAVKNYLKKQPEVENWMILAMNFKFINNGVVYEIRKNSASDEIATKTLAELGKENEEFKKTNSESLRKKVQYVCNKIKLLKRKGNADKCIIIKSLFTLHATST
jgi:hypothetical protein